MTSQSPRFERVLDTSKRPNARFGLLRFGGARATDDSNSYYRYLKDQDVTAEASKNTILSLVDLFNKQLLRVVVDPPADEDSEVAGFLQELRDEQPTMIFA